MRIRYLAASCALIVGLGSLLGPTEPAAATSSTHYVNNLPGSGCSDGGAGTSLSQPWCDFTPANAMTFGPGDSLLLARGASWNQQLTVHGSGSASSLAVLGAYGSGNRPRILRNSQTTDMAVDAQNPSYWSYQDLELANAGVGLRVYYNTLDHQGLNFSDIFVHNIGGYTDSTSNLQCASTNRVFLPAGIDITGDLPAFSSTDYAVQNITFTNIEGTHNVDSVSMDFCNGVASTSGGLTWQYTGPALTTDGGDGHTLIRNVTMRQLNFHGDDGNGTSGGCPDSLRLDDVENVLVLDSSIDSQGCATSSGTAGTILIRTAGVRFVNNSVTNEVNNSPATPDQTAFDLELLNLGTTWQNNYIANNAGPGIEFLGIHGSTDHSTGHTVSANLFVANGGRTANQTGSIFRAGSDTVPTATVRHNLYSEPAGGFADGPTTPGLALSGNTAVTGPTNAAQNFSGTQGTGNWTYEYSTDSGSTWVPLTWDAALNRWDSASSATYIDRFEQFPAPCSNCQISRTWTAPQPGMISIRAQALKATATGGGDGAGVRVLLNTDTLWARKLVTDQTGVSLTQDNVSVNAGDKLRFSVDDGPAADNTADQTSWNPSIAYTPATAVTNNSFEDPTLPYGTYAYHPAAAGWTFGTQTGIESNTSAFGAAAAPEGTQAAFLQDSSTGSCLTQTLSGLHIGTNYSFTFAAADRASLGGQSIQVTLGGTSLGTYSPATTSFADISTTAAMASSTTETLSLCGTAAGDHAAFIDNVRQNQPIVQNPGFENPVQSDFSYGPIPNSGWTFGTHGGIQHNGSAFNAATAPEGTQTALLQSDTLTGCLQQAITGWTANPHTVSFAAAARGSGFGGQSIQVWLDSVSLGTYTPTSTNFSTYTTPSITPSAGTHTLKFCGTQSGDHTAFLDQVAVS